MLHLSLGLMFLQRGANSYEKQGGGFTPVLLEMSFSWPGLCTKKTVLFASSERV